METTLADPQQIAHDAELWYADGTVVLETQGTYFKVHRGILAKASPVFQTMFAPLQNPTGGEIYDGCPVFHLQDIAQDLRHLLKALHDTRCAVIVTLLSGHALIHASLS